jgi:DNA-binding MurR/RpiR family transcriptional regulator
MPSRRAKPTPSSSYEQLEAAIARAYPKLSPQLQQIARFALARPNELALGTVATLAEAADVQPSALIRFANALQFAGFSDMQQLFRARLLERSGSYRERIGRMQRNGASAGDASVLHRFVGDAVEELSHLEEAVQPADLANAARLICTAERLHVLAQRRAFPIACYLAYALGRLELKVQLLAGLGGMLGESLRAIDAEDLLIVASFQPYSPEVIEAARAAHARGVPVVAFTDNPLSPLKGAATTCFELGQGANPAFRSLVAPLCLAQALVVSAGQQLTAPKRRAVKPSSRSRRDAASPRNPQATKETHT